jgi:hypothetical protein
MFAAAQSRRPREDLEQDLEAVRAQPVEIELRRTEREEAAHRIGVSAQPQREDRLCQSRRGAGDGRAGQ